MGINWIEEYSKVNMEYEDILEEDRSVLTDIQVDMVAAIRKVAEELHKWNVCRGSHE